MIQFGHLAVIEDLFRHFRHASRSIDPGGQIVLRWRSFFSASLKGFQIFAFVYLRIF